MKDYYSTLGVSEKASADEIKKAYRRLAKENHPDATGGDKKKGERFKEVSEAYGVLSDTEKRAQYDQLRANPAAQNAEWGGATGVDLGDIFAQFFGGQRGHSKNGAGPGYSIHVEEFGDGGGFGGFGDLFGGFTGRGARRRGAPRPPRERALLELDLREAALGTVKSLRWKGETMKVRIPAGVDTGARLRVGELSVEIRVRPDPQLRREGADIHSDVPIAFEEAALGARVEVPTLDGPVALTIPPGTSSGQTLRLRGKGVVTEPGSRGDQYVHVHIVVPPKLSPRARELLEQFQRETNFKPRG
jgi:molecular chaperone DnaJ